MKKIFTFLNIFLIIINLALLVYYDAEGGLLLKGVAAFGFVALGLVNLVFALLSKIPDKKYPIWMTAGLIACMTADIVLNIEFIPGAAIFAVGHILYCVAFSGILKPKATDLIPVVPVLAVAIMILKLIPSMDFGSALMEGICMGYAVVISCMVGKAIANFLRKRNRVNALILAGAVLFFFSDFMLVLCYFADAPKITDTLCLYTYFPAQSLLAHSIYHFALRSR